MNKQEFSNLCSRLVIKGNWTKSERKQYLDYTNKLVKIQEQEQALDVYDAARLCTIWENMDDAKMAYEWCGLVQRYLRPKTKSIHGYYSKLYYYPRTDYGKAQAIKAWIKIYENRGQRDKAQKQREKYETFLKNMGVN